VQNGDDATVAALLAAGTSVDATDNQRLTAPACAAAVGHDGVVGVWQLS